MKPGVYENLTFAEYSAIDALNCSTIVAASRTMDATLYEKEDTPGMRLGRAFHAYLLQHNVWERDWVTMPEGMTRRGNAWKDFQLTNKDREILSSDEFVTIRCMQSSLHSGKYNTALIALKGAQRRELTLVWENKKFGCLCKARLDAILDNIILDIKTSTTADPERWFRTGLNAGIKGHWQAHWYREGVQALIDPDCKAFYWILFENKEPWGISVVKATPPDQGETDMAYLAEQEMEPVIDRYLAAKRSGVFSGRPDRVVSAKIPQYYLKTAL